jgi:hypothetical protein
MKSRTFRQRSILPLIVILVMGSVVFLAGKLVYSPDIPFLISEDSTEWILYPSPPRLNTHRGNGVMYADFERTFDVSGFKSPTALRIRAFRNYRLWINGIEVVNSLDREASWKKRHTVDVSKFLVIGKNHIFVRVFNHKGPPALWLRTEGLDTDLETDSAWMASTPGGAARPAALASDNGVHGISLKASTPVESLMAKLPVLLVFFFVSTGVFVFFEYRRRKRPDSNPSFGLLGVTPLSIAAFFIIAWVAFFVHNSDGVFLKFGFDYVHHVKYVEYIVSNMALPLATDGFQMFQPPLFYMVAAVLMKSASFVFSADAAKLSLHFLPFLSGIGQILLAYFASAMIFPGNRTRQSLTVALVAITPMNIYMSHYVSNESFAALLIALALVMTMRMPLKERRLKVLLPVLGVVVGLAVLTKATALLLIPVIMLTVFYKLILEAEYPIGKAVWVVCGIIVIVLVVSGWFYIRNWVHLGKPIIGGWDPETGSQWWQAPGYHTADYFFRFGSVFSHPYYIGYYSFLDSIYATFWGDGYCGGTAFYEVRPPWNYDYMSSLYILAVPIAIAFLVGIYKMVREFFKRYEMNWLLILGSFFTISFGIVYLNIKVPYYSTAKAFYGLSLVVPFALTTAWGFDIIDGWCRNRGLAVARALMYGWLGTVMLVALSSFIVVERL